MKRPLAYVTAAWYGGDSENAERAAQYCRAVYNGHVVQQGTHETLLQQDGIYRRFVKIRQTASSWKI